VIISKFELLNLTHIDLLKQDESVSLLKLYETVMTMTRNESPPPIVCSRKYELE